MESIENEIVELLKEKNMDSIEILNKLNLGQTYDQVVMDILNSLTKDYVLYCSKKGRYMLFENSELSKNFVKGKFSDTNNDYGFVIVPGRKDDIFIHGSNINGALDGDTVLVEILKESKDSKKCEGRISKIIKHEILNKVGEVYHYEGQLMVSLDDKRFKKLTVLKGESEDLDRLVDGDKVLVTFASSKREKDYLYVKFIKRIGNINDPDIDILSIIADNGFDVEFPEDVIEQLKTIPTEVSKKEMEGRKDLRDEVIFTIDGDDTKDIDDAIQVKKLENGNYELGVHIADVSYYVKENSPLDIEARKRGTSVYLTDRVIPMLPHQLSNGICSLNPNVDRLATSCVMEIDKTGKVVHYDIFESVIRSRIQMTYKKVNDYLERGIVDPNYKEFTKSLDLCYELSKIVRSSKVKRGFIDFDTDEIKIKVDEKGKPIEITKRYSGIGEHMIEDFMIMANETVASHMFYMDLPAVYRVHGDPSEERLRKFLGVLSTIGITIKADLKKITPKTIQKIIDELKKYPQFKVFSVLMLSCMDKAIYDPNNIGHFGIASKCYTHFTSPIRRYPDTTTHRLLKYYFFSKDGITDEKIAHSNEVLPDICEHSSERERASIECEREVDELKEAEYMEDHIGEEFEGMVSGCTNFGMFVELDNLIEGLVPIVEMEGYYVYDQKTESLYNSKNKSRFSLGDRLIVTCVRASKEEKKIDFNIVRRIQNGKKKKENKETS